MADPPKPPGALDLPEDTPALPAPKPCGAADLPEQTPALPAPGAVAPDATADVSGPLPSPRAVLERGAKVGRYVVLDQLGQGGMGVVYCAFDPELDRKVAIKLLQADEVGGSAGRDWLMREAQAMAKLSHPNVIAVHDVGTLSEGRLFIAMELVEGLNLRQWLKQEHGWREIVSTFRDAGQGLAAAHAAGLVHRDFKPDNVLLGKDGRVRVLDFGLARNALEATAAPPNPSSSRAPPGQEPTPPTVDPAAATGSLNSGSLNTQNSSRLSAPLTQAGRMLGTPAYMAPEQYAGQAANAKSDQFSFGVSLFEALYRQRPFSSSAKPRWTPREPTGVKIPRYLRRILGRALAEKPEARYPSMEELLLELGRDPYHTHKRFAVAAGLSLFMVAAVSTGRLLSSRQSNLCRAMDGKQAGLWSFSRRAAIRAAFLGTGSAEAQDAFARSSAILEQYAQKIDRARVDNCVATRVRGEQSDEAMGLRAECLDRRTGELEALIDVFAQADPQVVRKAIQAAYALSPVEDCADLAALKSQVKPPPARDRTAIQDLRKKLLHTKALFDAGKLPQARAEAQTVLKDAQGISYLPLEAESNFALANTLMNTAPAVELYEHAFHQALASGEDELAVHAGLGNTTNLSNLHRPAEAGQWLALADAMLDRLGRPRSLEPEYLACKAILLAREGKMEDSVRTAEQYLEEQRRTFSPDSNEAARGYDTLGMALGFAGRAAESVRVLEKERAILVRLFGAQNPRLVVLYINLSASYNEAGDGKTGAQVAQMARGILSTAYGPKAHFTSTATLNLAEALTTSGDFNQARHYALEALHNWQETMPGTDSIAEASYDLCALDLLDGQPSVAYQEAKTAYGLRAAHMSADEPARAATAGCLARAELALHRPRDAKAHLQEALAALEKTSAYPVEHAEDQFAQARLLGATPQGRLQALSAQALFLKYQRTRRAEAVQTWLKAAAVTQPASARTHEG